MVCLERQDSKGRLIGINTAIADPSGKGANSGVGFAIPIDQVKGLVEQILTYGRIIRPVLGISIAPPQVLVRVLGFAVHELTLPHTSLLCCLLTYTKICHGKSLSGGCFDMSVSYCKHAESSTAL